MSNWYYCATGGSGAGYHAKIIITETGEYGLSVGSGGTGRGGARGETASGTNASASTITKGNTTLISAGGGTAAAASSVGSGGVLTKDSSLIEDTVYTSANGQSGNRGSTYASGRAGPISGHTWGGSGNASGSSAGGGADSSYHGYIMIKYVGPLPDES